jgi:glutathione S-transferase
MTTSSIRVHRHPLSGHSHRVELFLSMLGLRFERIDVDLAGRAHKAPAFLSKNAFGQLPVIEDGDVVLADSNAILVYLAMRYDPARTWLPSDPVVAAHVMRWLSVAAGPLVQGPAAARLAHVFGAKVDVARARALADDLFAVLDRELSSRTFVVGDRPTIADLALYAYSAHAPEGGVALHPYPHLRRWLSAIEALPGFVGMQRSPVVAIERAS